MKKPLHSRVFSYKELSSKGLITDLKEAAGCEIKRVCRIACGNCPNVTAGIKLDEVLIVGLKSYSVIITDAERDDLNIFLSAENIDDWLHDHHLTPRKNVVHPALTS
ncbi:hypothetical protein [Psychromonas aquimarina]|uniref:hypothetical protein n=1 Tax=Psychromonas aquimarina TaxID=444919 RepID=UPI000490ADCF|nr:hypothetical protein [Psychromonas aquimarina]